MSARPARATQDVKRLEKIAIISHEIGGDLTAKRARLG
jgi:hypothetical protein